MWSTTRARKGKVNEFDSIKKIKLRYLLSFFTYFKGEEVHQGSKTDRDMDKVKDKEIWANKLEVHLSFAVQV